MRRGGETEEKKAVKECQGGGMETLFVVAGQRSYPHTVQDANCPSRRSFLGNFNTFNQTCPQLLQAVLKGPTIGWRNRGSAASCSLRTHGGSNGAPHSTKYVRIFQITSCVTRRRGLCESESFEQVVLDLVVHHHSQRALVGSWCLLGHSEISNSG